jgi:hypothetical protein
MIHYGPDSREKGFIKCVSLANFALFGMHPHLINIQRVCTSRLFTAVIVAISQKARLFATAIHFPLV